MAPEVWTELATAADICWLCPTSLFPLCCPEQAQRPLKNPEGPSLPFLSPVCFKADLMSLLLVPLHPTSRKRYMAEVQPPNSFCFLLAFATRSAAAM